MHTPHTTSTFSVTTVRAAALSHWMIFHWRKAADVVSTWEAELYRCPVDRKLLMIYLANDVMQSRKRHKARPVRPPLPARTDTMAAVV